MREASDRGRGKITNAVVDKFTRDRVARQRKRIAWRHYSEVAKDKNSFRVGCIHKRI